MENSIYILKLYINRLKYYKLKYKMNSNNNNNKTTQTKKTENHNCKCRKTLNPFRMDISDDFYDPFNFSCDLFENKMFKSFRNLFNDFDSFENTKEETKEEEKPKDVEPVEEKPKEVVPEEEKPKEVVPPKDVEPVEEEKPKEVVPEEEKMEVEEEINTDSKKEEPKEEEINTDSKKEEPKEEEIKTDSKKEEPKTEKNEKKEENGGKFYSKIYYSSYSNLNGKPNQESYQSQTIQQTKDGHDISETKECYKNSDGVQKTAYQRGLDGKTTRFIKEKNTKTGKNKQHKVVKGIEENEIKDFNKLYNDYAKKYNFRKSFNDFDLFDPFGFNKKQISDGNTNYLLHRLLF